MDICGYMWIYVDICGSKGRWSISGRLLNLLRRPTFLMHFVKLRSESWFENVEKQHGKCYTLLGFLLREVSWAVVILSPTNLKDII